MLHFGCRGDEFAVLNPFGGDQLPGNLVDFVAPPANHDDFQTIMLIEMDMQAGIDHDIGFMLHVG